MFTLSLFSIEDMLDGLHQIFAGDNGGLTTYIIPREKDKDKAKTKAKTKTNTNKNTKYQIFAGDNGGFTKFMMAS